MSASSDGSSSRTRIVLAVDGATSPARAVGAISRVAAKGAEVIVLHVHDVDRREADVVDDKIEAVAAHLQDAGFSVVVVTSHALPHRVMIVVGGGGPLLAALGHGTVSSSLRHRAPCPVQVEG